MSQTPPARLKVLCVDDNELVADALRKRLQSEPEMAWAGCVSDGAVVIDRVREAMPDVVLMDIDMPGVDTFDLVEKLSAQLPQVRVVMFSGHVQIAYIERALDCGAWGYLSKNDDTAALIEGIRKVGAGQIALSREVEVVQRSARRAAEDRPA